MKKVFSLLITLAMLISTAVVPMSVSADASVWDGTTDTDWAGEGTEASPYLITSAAELAGLASNVNGGNDYSGKYFKITNNIDLTNTANADWTPIGDFTDSLPFEGTIDGEGLCLADTASNDDYFCLSVPEGESMQFSNKVFERKYYVDQDTVVFATPHQSTYYSYNVVGRYNDVFTSGSYVAALYDVADDGRIGAIHYDGGTITKYTSSTGGNEIYIDPTNSPVLYVTSITTGVDDGEEVTIIRGIENGREVERILSKTLLAASEDPNLIMEGAVIQYETNDLKIARAENSELREEIVLFKHILNLNDNNPYKTTFGYEDSIINRISEATTLTDTGLTISYAQIKGVTPNAINIESNREITLLKNVGTIVMHYDRNSHTYTRKTLSDLQPGMDVFVRQRTNNVIEIVYFD